MSTDSELLRQHRLLEDYALWSEQTYAAGFLEPTETTVREFRAWLAAGEKLPVRELEEYERRFLAEFERQEAAERRDGNGRDRDAEADF